MVSLLFVIVLVVFIVRADATAADTRGYMGLRYELHWSVLGARDLN